MEASSSKIFLTMVVHHNGHFTRNPFAYVKGKKLTLHKIGVSCFKFEDNFEYVGTTVDTVVTEIYYNPPKNSLAKDTSIPSGADSDVASVDHLLDGEEELRQVRFKKAKCKINKKNLDDYDFNVPLENAIKKRMEKSLI
nr:hypothetical protein [Tanacetum cinerariifolium]